MKDRIISQILGSPHARVTIVGSPFPGTPGYAFCRDLDRPWFRGDPKSHSAAEWDAELQKLRASAGLRRGAEVPFTEAMKQLGLRGLVAKISAAQATADLARRGLT